MRKSRLFYLLKGLTPAEFKRFSKFVQSPFFCTNPTQFKFYQLLKKHHPKFRSPHLTREKIFQKLYPDKTFNYHHFGNLITEMTHLAEEFIAQLELEREGFQKQKILAKGYGRRNLYAAFEKKSLHLMEQLEAQPFRDASYFQEMMELKGQYFFHPNTNRYTLERDYPKEMMDLLDRYFALSKLQLASVLKSREKMLAATYEIKMLDEILEGEQVEPSKEEPLFSIYANIFALHQPEKKEQAFLVLKTLFEKQIEKIRKAEQKDILQHLLNHAIRQINSGHFDYNQEAWSLYKLGLAYDLIMENEKMREGTFMNIAGVASILGEFEWAEHFIQRYAGFLEKEMKIPIKALTISELRFRQKAFDEVIDILNFQNFSQVFYAIHAKSLFIRAWFEKFQKDEALDDLLFAQMAAFEKFLKRKEVLASKRAEGWEHFLKVLRKMANFKIQNKITKASKKQLLTSLEKIQPLYGKVWLKQKIIDL